MDFLGPFSSSDCFHQVPAGEPLEKPEVSDLSDLGRPNGSADIQGQSQALLVTFLAIRGRAATFGQLFRCLPFVASTSASPPWKALGKARDWPLESTKLTLEKWCWRNTRSNLGLFGYLQLHFPQNSDFWRPLSVSAHAFIDSSQVAIDSPWKKQKLAESIGIIAPLLLQAPQCPGKDGQFTCNPLNNPSAEAPSALVIWEIIRHHQPWVSPLPPGG